MWMYQSGYDVGKLLPLCPLFKLTPPDQPDPFLGMFIDNPVPFYQYPFNYMPRIEVFTIAEQVAAHLRQEIARGRWQELMPGRNELAKELGFNNKTLEAALKLLQKEGLLINQGAGRKRLINHSANKKTPTKLRVAVLLLDKMDRANHFMIELFHLLEEAGCIAFYPEKSMSELSTEPDYLTDFVQRTGADAWIITAGSREILEWFSSQDIPAFAMFGRRSGLPIASAGPDKVTAVSDTTRRLLNMGHRRISLLCRPQRRNPRPGKSERTFIETLSEAGIQTGPYNLPDWKENKASFLTMLDSLFLHTPPTALIVDEAFLFNTTYFHLTHRGLRVPGDVSIICTDNDPNFDWCHPSVAHIHWDYRPVINRVVRWVNNISHGKKDLRQTLTKAEFIEGETIGPVKT